MLSTLASATFLLYASTTAIVLGAPLSSSAPLPTATASSNSGNVNTALGQYAPPAACIPACDSFMADLGRCNDDSCICSQDGLDHFAECAVCDTRISMWHGNMNMTNTLTDFKGLCEREGHSMSNVTFPTNATASTSLASSTISTTSTSGTASETIVLTSAFYASLSIASGTGMVTMESQGVAVAPTGGIVAAPAVQATGGAVERTTTRASLAAIVAMATLLML